ncbi:hypothetical protein [Corynebacterium deserti]|uniref:hypothetical protein n=1 Tax=Corynebacterium deserti TaxID=1408191 RepID=UPI0018D0C903|nr:hypothetical protein [Corynebacterium deserti]
MESQQSENIVDGKLLYPALLGDIEIPKTVSANSLVSTVERGNWEPTQKPNSKIVPGAMRSDRESIPGGFTNEEVDRAEIEEAKLSNTLFLRAQSDTTCKVYQVK